MESVLARCQELLGYTFSDPDLLAQALTHPSSESAEVDHNERMEFLGDAVLGMVICEDLYRRLPGAREGELTRVKSVVVSRSTLARVARTKGLGRFVQVGRGLVADASLSMRVLGNLYEAVVAALYVDGGLKAARAFILETLEDEIERVVAGEYHHDFKSLLQQYAQRVLGTTPAYTLVSEEGPDHLKRFCVAAVIAGTRYACGEGQTKKQAEQVAAEKTYQQLLDQEEREAGNPPEK